MIAKEIKQKILDISEQEDIKYKERNGKDYGIINNKLYLFEQIPLKKLEKAIKVYASVLENDETPIMLFDDTIWGSAKKGFILTTKRIYISKYDQKATAIDISGIFDVFFKLHEHSELFGDLTFVTQSGNLFLSSDAVVGISLLFLLSETLKLLNPTGFQPTQNT